MRPQVIATLSTLIATAALVLSALLLVEVQSQRKELRQVRGLSIDTASTVLLQHKAIGLVMSSQANILRVTRGLTRGRPAPRRTLYSAPEAAAP